MKPQRAWVVLNKNGNPVGDISTSLFATRKQALEMIELWCLGNKDQMTVQRVTVQSGASHE